MEQKENDLAAVVDSLFSEARSSFSLKDGTKVTISPAKVKQINDVIQFIKKLVERAPKDKIEALISLVAEEQRKLIAAGKPANALNFDTGAIVDKVIGNHSLLIEAFSASIDIITDLVPLFTNVSKEVYENLELDEAIVIATGIFAVNYGFFTRSLPPIIKVAVAALRLKMDGGKQNAKTAKAKR